MDMTTFILGFGAIAGVLAFANTMYLQRRIDRLEKELATGHGGPPAAERRSVA